MLNQEAEEKLARILVDRIEDINSSILIKIGNAIKQIKASEPTIEDLVGNEVE